MLSKRPSIVEPQCYSSNLSFFVLRYYKKIVFQGPHGHFIVHFLKKLKNEFNFESACREKFTRAFREL